MIRCLAAVTAFAVLSSGCGESCPEPTYEGGAQDEAFRAISDAEEGTSIGDPKAATFLEPDEAQRFTRESLAPTFRWSSPIRTANARTRHSSPRATWWDRVRSIVISDAHAHGTPFTGDLYDLTVEVPGEKCPVRVVTGNDTWTPSTEDWARVVEAAPGERRVQIFSAYLRDDRVTEGPYAPEAPLVFEVVAP